MFRRMIFGGLFTAMLALPAFSLPTYSLDSELGTGFNSDANGEIPGACVVDYLGVTSGNTTLEAIWVPRISGAITLDSKIYTSESDTTGIVPNSGATPTPVYSEYGTGIYSDSAAQNPVTQLATVPANAGYEFLGFYTEKFSGGKQVIDAGGNIITDAASTFVSERGQPATFYARWKATKHMCPDGYMGEDTESDADCYKEVSVACSTINPYEHGTATYRNTSATCRQYYGNESVNNCESVPDSTCAVTGLTCNDGYTLISENGRLGCTQAFVECEAGTYLPANANECVVCTEDNYCLGGLYTPYQSNAQGITPCESGLKSPAGSQKAADCGYILHVGDDKLYLHADKNTSPSLVVEVEGQKWYGDATPVANGKKTISDDTNKTMHMEYKGTEYTVHGRYVE